MPRLRALVLLSCALSLAAAASACIWDRDTIRDETRALPQVFDLITGQFEHHGTGYYEARLADCKRSLGTDNVDVGIRNDMGVALLKLGRYEESLEVFRKLEAEDGRRYETLSNLGVLFKKMGRFQEAADYTEKALAINPEGHLGMRDFYLKMLRWRATVAAAPETMPVADFLGREYAENLRGIQRLSDDDFERLLSLVRSDKTFVDAYFVLGDDLERRGHLNLALWSWSRALQLGHPATDRIRSRVKAVYDYWTRQGKGGMAHSDADEALAAITKELETAAGWQKIFETVEAEMVGANPNVQFEDVAAELTRRGIARVAPSEHGRRNTMQEEVDEEEVAVRQAFERKARAIAEAKARSNEAKRARIAVADRESKRSFWMLGGAAMAVGLLAAGLMLVRRR